MCPEYFTPPELARRWRIEPEKVRKFIAAGELRAVDISLSPGNGRPRWRVSASAVEDFEKKRAAIPPSPPVRRIRRRRTDGDIIHFDYSNGEKENGRRAKRA